MKNKNQMCQSEAKPIIPVPAKVIADIVGCSESLVEKVRGGYRNRNTKAGAKVIMAEDLMATCMRAAIDNVKLIIKEG